MGGGASKQVVPAASAGAVDADKLSQENVRLEADVKRLKDESDSRQREVNAHKSKIASLLVEINRLRAGDVDDHWSTNSLGSGILQRMSKAPENIKEIKSKKLGDGDENSVFEEDKLIGLKLKRSSEGSKLKLAENMTNRTPSRLAKQLSAERKRGSKRKKAAHMSQAEEAGHQKTVMHMPRGGAYVWTNAGPIQFGLPPETVKDSMNLGLDVPTIFVVPRERFNMQYGINVSEIEFPAFFNFFVRRRQMTLVTHRDCRDDLYTIMKEALDGPNPDQLYIDDEYSRWASEDKIKARPDHKTEMAYFQEPRPGTPSIEVDSLIKFAFFDANGECDVGDDVIIKDEWYGYTLLQDGNVLAAISDDEAKSCFFPEERRARGSSDQESNASEGPLPDSESTMTSESETEGGSLAGSEDIGKAIFNIPRFGLTVLGNSHGFDPQGSTSGFVIWINGQGIMVDPPPHSGEVLKRCGIQPKLITATILTHCHADHDAGTIQKMITEDKITLMTTKTVFQSLLRKYSGVSGLSPDFLAQLVSFRAVYVEEPTYWGGAEFRFFYSLHAIPCVGFEVAFDGKRIVYSADTYFEPEGLCKMRDRGILSPERCDALLNFPWDCDLVLHEAGVPPIHTPLTAFENVPEEYRKNIQLIHIGKKDQIAAEEKGFKVAKVGIENTQVLSEGTTVPDTIKFLQLIASVDIFRSFPITQALELLLMSNQVGYEPGQIIAEKGSPGDKFMVIMSGEASVSFGSTKKIFKVGDYLGEISVITGEDRTATILAETDCTIIEVDKYAFHYFITKDKNLYAKMECLVRSRMDGSWHAIARNSVLRNLSAAQKTSLQAFLHIRRYNKGEAVWHKGDEAQGAVLLLSGKFIFEEVHNADPYELLTATRHPHLGERSSFEEDGQEVVQFEKLSTGVLICDMVALLNQERLTVTLKCDSEEGVLFYISQENIIGFLDANPMMMLALLRSLLVP